jgi:3D (Asp-Asp-Asp) domain-containing protein
MPGGLRNQALSRRAALAEGEILSIIRRITTAARGRSLRLLPALTLIAAALAPVCPAQATPSTGLPPPPSGGVGLAPIQHPRRPIPRPPSKKSRGRWLRSVTITEYWPAPERWFLGRLVHAPGLSGQHRIDWLYSAMGVSMQGEGIGLDGRIYHIDSLGNAGWVTADGKRTSPGNGWAAGAPYWRAGGYWRNRSGAVTFALAAGGWSAGRGRTYIPLHGVTFAAGASLPLRYYQSLAVDPSVIPLGSRVYVPAYRDDGYGGWFIARDTGGAIGGHHIDVYRPPPATPGASGQYLTGQRVLVIKPRR